MRRATAGIGRALVTLGILILLFVVYQLWGTGIFTARAQNALKNDFRQQVQQAENDTVDPAPTTVRPGGSTTTTIPFSHRLAPLATPPDGQIEGAIKIPKIGISFYYVEGTSRDDLKKGPGHYPGTPLPGTLGNAAIAGHRTTYLHPFGDLDKVQPGDDIIIQTLAGTVFDYKMYKQLIVLPTDVWVVANTSDAELTLTACNPKGSAAQRIVVKARLVSKKSAPPTRPRPVTTGAGKGRSTEPSLAQGLSGQRRSLAPSVLWGIIVALVGLAWWWGFRRWRHPRTWLIGVLPFLIALFPFYVYLERARFRPATDGVNVERSHVERAALRIAPFVRRTPVLSSHALDEWIGAQVFVKAEHLQRIGAFKYRGATNAVQSLPDDEAARGVAAHSSGNHAAALARAAATRGIPAHVVMPRGASAAKRAAVTRLGAQITLCDNTLEARRATLAEVLDRTGAVEIHPFDDERVIAGAGTAALELAAEVDDLDVVVTPIGGGGLCSGTCVAVAPTRVIGASPYDRSATVADGLRTGCSPRTESILRDHGVEQVAVAEAEIIEAMRAVWERTKQLVEPSSAIAFAAARAAALDGRRVGIISSGGNVDLDALPLVDKDSLAEEPMTHRVVNVEMAAAWDGDEGDDWARHWERHDRTIRPYHGTLLDAVAVGRANRVLDVGCGNGESTRDAARLASEGSAFGIDLSSRMIERARELARLEGVSNVVFEHADVEGYPLEAAAHDVCISRFGAMFFADPQRAFGHIANSIRPGGRLGLVAWRPAEDNEWFRSVFRALAAGRDLALPIAGTPGPFGLADPARTRHVLAGAGFDHIELEAVDRPFWLGADADDAFAFFRSTGVARGLTQNLDAAEREKAFNALHTTMTEHTTDDGVAFSSAAWLVTARRTAG